MSWRAAAPAGWCLGFGGSNAAFQAEGNGSLCGEGGGLGKTHLSPTGCSQSFVCCDWGFLCITDRQEWVWVVKQLHLQTEAKFAVRDIEIQEFLASNPIQPLFRRKSVSCNETVSFFVP